MSNKTGFKSGKYTLIVNSLPIIVKTKSPHLKKFLVDKKLNYVEDVSQDDLNRIKVYDYGKEECYWKNNSEFVDLECSICYNLFVQPQQPTIKVVRQRQSQRAVRLTCDHYFHCLCITNWRKTGRSTCPLCRHNFIST